MGRVLSGVNVPEPDVEPDVCDVVVDVLVAARANGALVVRSDKAATAERKIRFIGTCSFLTGRNPTTRLPWRFPGYRCRPVALRPSLSDWFAFVIILAWKSFGVKKKS
jgi:hypothetical protein